MEQSLAPEWREELHALFGRAVRLLPSHGAHATA
jgi:hypothetical protein